MDITINNLYFKYDDNSCCINAYDTITNSIITYIHCNNNEVMDKSSFEGTCQRWASATDSLYQGVDYNSWY